MSLLQGLLTASGAVAIKAAEFGRFSINSFSINAQAWRLDRLYRRFDPKMRARRDVLRGESAGDGQSAEERHLFRRHQAMLNTEKDRFARALKALDFTMRRYGSAPVLDQQEFFDTARQQAAAFVRKATPSLVASRSRVASTEFALRMFMRENQLRREPSSRHPAAGALILFLSWVVEMALNQAYLITAGAGSASQIILLVGVAAALNVGLGYGIGTLGLKNLNHVQAMRRNFGICAITGLGALCIGLHLVLAQYRLAIDSAQYSPTGVLLSDEVVALRIDTAFIHLGDAIRAHPLGFMGDGNALLLFAVGLAFAAVTTGSTYLLVGDKYPGYAEEASRLRSAQRDDAKGIARLHHTVTRLVSSVRNRIDKTVRDGERRLSAMIGTINEAVAEAHRYEARAEAIDQSLFCILQDYRDEYSAVLPDGTPEGWADEFPQLNRDTPVETDHFLDIEDMERARQKTLEAEAHQLRRKLTTLEVELRSQLEEALATIGAGAESRFAAELKLRAASDQFPGAEA